MIDRSLKVIEVNDHEATTVMTVGDLLDVVIPARSFLGNAKLNPVEQRAVSRLRELHALVQRDFSGQKKTNARGDLADYIETEWLPFSNGHPPAGFLPGFTLFFPEQLNIGEDGVAHVTSKAIFIDGESRGEALLVNIERLGDDEVDELLHRQLAVHIIHGIDDPKVIAKYFSDVNGRGVQVNKNLVIMTDYTDPYAEITKRVFASLGLELETRQRQVSAKSAAVLTGLQARNMVAAVAKGVAAVSYGAKPIPEEGVDLEKLETTATVWLKRVFDTLGPELFRDKSQIVRSVPVSVSLGALGKAFYDGDTEAQQAALAVLSDEQIDWSVGEQWASIAGRVNPNTEKFAVGGGKEYAYATFNALTKPDSEIGRQIRHQVEVPAAA
jgi:hypothetical protein